ncbi:MAG: glycosyltransferase 87 family protein [Bacteroidota bacterium]
MSGITRFRIVLTVNIVTLMCMLGFSAYRDIQLEKQYPSDLRNRVVGARLQKDGKDPYFYKWKKDDGFRYIDPANYDSLKVSNITASPAFHDLMIPFCELPQRTISFNWLCFQYFILALITLLFFRLTSNNIQKFCIVNLSVLFTCTDAWKLLIANGQLYFFYAFLIATTVYGLWKSEKKRNFLIAGLSSGLLILLKPTALIIIIPFIIQYKLYYRYILTTLACLLTYGLFVMINQNEKKFWASYNMAIGEQIKVHQGLNPALQENEQLPTLSSLEGFDFKMVNENYEQHPIFINSENGNVFVIIRQLLHVKISTHGLLILFITVTLLLVTGFIYLKSNNAISLPRTVLFAFLLYMLAEIFGPVYRHQYNSVQWLPILLTGTLILKKWNEPAAILIALGLLMNFSKLTFIPMQHTMGEICWVIATLLIIFKKNVQREKNDTKFFLSTPKTI